MPTRTSTEPAAQVKQRPWWMLYLTLLVAGLFMLADAYAVAHLHRWTAKFGFALIYSAAVLFIGRGRPLSYVSAVIVCLSVIATFVW